MPKNVAIYAGSFDPPTKGHIWMIEKSAAIFDKLIVTIGTNPDKHCVFTANERLEMLYYSTKELTNVSIKSFPFQYLVNFAKSEEAQFILRGIRSQEDYGKEKDMRNVNEDLDPSITTIFLMPPRELAEISSSMVKGLIGPKGWERVVSRYVSEPVLQKLRSLHYANTQ